VGIEHWAISGVEARRPVRGMLKTKTTQTTTICNDASIDTDNVAEQHTVIGENGTTGNDHFMMENEVDNIIDEENTDDHLSVADIPPDTNETALNEDIVLEKTEARYNLRLSLNDDTTIG
jgi:hypothetical protein